jgi:hypothetical protein
VYSFTSGDRFQRLNNSLFKNFGLLRKNKNTIYDLKLYTCKFYRHNDDIKRFNTNYTPTIHHYTPTIHHYTPTIYIIKETVTEDDRRMTEESMGNDRRMTEEIFRI